MPRYLVTSALPYANGPIHLGHIAGAYLPADVFTRFLRLSGEDVIYICGTDEHGKPITLRAIKEGVSPQVVVDRYHERITSDFDRIAIEFDNFSGTARPAHHELSQEFFRDLLDKGYLKEGPEETFWCPKDQISLADREVVGICPKCKDHEARGDECKRTGSWLQAVDLIEPRCTLCGTTPERRETRSWFLDLPAFSERISEWLDTKTWWKENVLTFVRAWLRDGLRLRSVTRDMPWGVPVPVDGVENKVLYVWLDAPIGYISSTKEWAERQGKPDAWRDYWLDPETRLIHFIGKDNIPFHAITWPATLIGYDEGKPEGEQVVLPYDIPANEYLTLEGRPFSTSEGWAEWTGDALDALETVVAEGAAADVLRYCLAANAPESKDADFSWAELRDRNNGELADVYGNLASRVFKFIQKYHDGKIPELVDPTPLEEQTLAELEAAPAKVGELFRSYKVRAACAAVMDVARLGNRYYDAGQPWVTRKTDLQAAGNTMHVCCRILRALAVLSWPVVPASATKLWRQLGEEGSPSESSWDAATSAEPSLAGRTIGDVQILFKKLEEKFVEEQVERLTKQAAAAAGEAKVSEEEKVSPEDKVSKADKSATAAEAAPEGKAEITYDDFAKLDIRVGLVLEAERIPKADKLLKLQIDLGTEKRQVLAGVAEYYEPEELVGKRVPILVNLAPRKIRGEMSQGMMLAGNDVEGAAVLLNPAKDVPPGSPIS